MTSFLTTVFTLMFLASIVGMIFPRLFDKLFKRRVKRWMFAVSTIVLFLLIGVTAPSSPKDELASSAVGSSKSQNQAGANDNSEGEEAAQAEAEQRKKAEAEQAEAAKKAAKEAEEAKKAKKTAEAKAVALERAKHPEWDKSEIDAMKNGNPQMAFQMLEALGNAVVTPITAKAGSVFKAPWNYYGKPIEFTVNVVIVQDYPPESDSYVKSEIVGQASDGTILDIFSTVDSGDIQVGDEITVVAYPVGLVTVDNKMGGQTDQLALVTNKL
ncbi:hypothetical protein SAMN05444162_3070 [Paenibacillaceae bacterium GAS479]|nr:hypothetical protein SAMN05444162_3070 [Paenibacillaceae bacterium GAS479]